jgi:hypothetical protein
LIAIVQESEKAMDAQWKRIEAVVGTAESATFNDQLAAFYDHLLSSLELPYDVTGSEDFRWEERCVIGGASSIKF